ncbi:uncharacterized protein MKZ38_002516 [Zalerion maritima]|uniref:protein-histidine N-methyltransferase n=1 Tax=Zalerion maritima TaxID=339359 RepID=A0AAD5WQS6_9PEZI|nr:uncharacterized protein MKZ38_002516 [Zalerion maritima]
MSGFTFSFGGDDIEDEEAGTSPQVESRPVAAERPSLKSAGAFPVAGKPQLPALHHGLDHMFSQLPPKVAYDLLDAGEGLYLPRRELWDVKVQVMAEQDVDAEMEPGLGTHDVKTGVYEGGFKSWESSVDLVKELKQMDLSASCLGKNTSLRVTELGCGTALPSLALFQEVVSSPIMRGNVPLLLTVADYNPTVLQLVTLPNFILTWALVAHHESSLVQQALDVEGKELELSEDILGAFRDFLSSNKIFLSFVSGGWSNEFVEVLYTTATMSQRTSGDTALLLGAETIYSPLALETFTETMMSILREERMKNLDGKTIAVVGAKRHYFGVGGSLDDFIDKARESGCSVDWLREEGQGVRRGVVMCQLQ